MLNHHGSFFIETIQSNLAEQYLTGSMYVIFYRFSLLFLVNVGRYMQYLFPVGVSIHASIYEIQRVLPTTTTTTTTITGTTTTTITGTTTTITGTTTTTTTPTTTTTTTTIAAATTTTSTSTSTTTTTTTATTMVQRYLCVLSARVPMLSKIFMRIICKSSHAFILFVNL